MRTNAGVMVGAAMVVAGFFMGWLGFDGGGAKFSVSGWEIAKVARQHGFQYYFIYLLPIGAVAAGVMAVRDRVRAAKWATLVGGVFLAWAVFEVIHILWRTTFLGLWLTLAGAGVLLFAGLATLKTTRGGD